MKQYVERMVREKEELEGKIKKEKKALESNPFDMTETGRFLLEKQVKAMESYLEALTERLVYESGGEIQG